MTKTLIELAQFCFRNGIDLEYIISEKKKDVNYVKYFNKIKKIKIRIDNLDDKLFETKVLTKITELQQLFN